MTLLLNDVIARGKIRTVDFLACDTLRSADWRRFYKLVQAASGVRIGASDNPTGNLKYGGDWTMESDGEDIQRVYFNPSLVNYSGILADPNIRNFGEFTFIADDSKLVAIITHVDVYASFLLMHNIPIGFPANVFTRVHFDFPRTVDRYTVTTLRCFYGCTELSSVTIPNSVQTLGDRCFAGCAALTSVTIPNSVKTLGDWSFNCCDALTSVTIPNSVQTLGYGCFANCPAASCADVGYNPEFSRIGRQVLLCQLQEVECNHF